MPELLLRKAKWKFAVNLLTSHWKAARDLEGVNCRFSCALSSWWEADFIPREDGARVGVKAKSHACPVRCLTPGWASGKGQLMANLLGVTWPVAITRKVSSY